MEAINLNHITLLGTTIQLPMTALETGLGGGMSDPIRYLRVFFSLPIGLRLSGIAHNPTSGIRAKIIGSRCRSIIVKVVGDHNSTNKPVEHNF